MENAGRAQHLCILVSLVPSGGGEVKAWPLCAGALCQLSLATAPGVLDLKLWESFGGSQHGKEFCCPEASGGAP